MSNTLPLAAPTHFLSRQMVGAIVLTFAYLGTMLVLFLEASTETFEPTLLLPILNTIFAGALPIFVSIIAMRLYFLGGLSSILLMGCGLMTFGVGAVLAGWLIGGPQGANVNVTIYNLSVLLSAVFHAVGIVLFLRNETPESRSARKKTNLIWLVSGIFIVLLGVTLAAIRGATPLFFVQGVGPTLLRQLVLGCSSVLFFLSALFLLKIFNREQRPFYYWYAMSLFMISLGLVAALIQPSVGSSMGWLNRVGHYVAGIYAMAAILATSCYARKYGMPFRVEMTELFRQAQMSYDLLVETVTEPIVTTDKNFKIIQWNSAAARMFGYSQNEAVDKSLLDLVIDPASDEIFKSGANEIDRMSIDRSFVGSPIEITGKRKRADNFPLEVSSSGMRVQGVLLFVFVFRDSTTRKAIEDVRREQANELLKAKDDHFHAVVSVLSEAVVTHRRDGTIKMWNHAAERILGLTTEQLRGRKTIDWLTIHEDGTPFLVDTRPSQVVFRTGIPQLNVIMGIYKPDESLCWVLLNAVPIFEPGDTIPLNVVVTFLDITIRKQDEADLRIAASTFDSQESFIITDANNVILRVNQAFTENTGYTAEEVVGKTPRMFSSGRHNADFYREMWETLIRTGKWQGEIWDKRKSGEIYPKWLSITAVKTRDGVITHYVGSHIDITERKAAEVDIYHKAFYDLLTGLPNRRLLLERLQQVLVVSARSGRESALLFIDLDNFKTLNDTLGHDMGDLLLKQVALRLESCVREGDTVCRIGGDEFVVMLKILGEQVLEAAEHTKAVGEKILYALSQPYLLGAQEYHSTSSIGITLFGKQPEAAEELMKQADIAMYQAKKAGRNTLRFFDAEMQLAIVARASLEGELRKAQEGDQFHLYYQIQVDDTQHPLGAEALIRWIHPERGLVSPLQFIPLAEETGLILPIGLWVLDTACAKIKVWEQHLSTCDLVLAVNVSARQFNQIDFVAQVQATVQRHAINPARLKLELTESMLVDNIGSIIACMNVLKETGIQFSLDDFGTGYSSLQYIQQMPLNQLKIDQSFVRNLSADPEGNSIVRTIIAMAKGMNMDIIAEGVETDEQRQLLRLLGCNHYQGYFFSKPVPIEQFEALLKQGASSVIR